MLKRVIQNIPEDVKKHERFSIPKVRGHIQGNKTLLTNFNQIAETLRRPSEHILKFILRELATPGNIKNNIVVIGAKIPASRINEKIEKYAEEYVICKECNKPDTKLMKEGSFLFMKCTACGAKHSVKAKI